MVLKMHAFELLDLLQNLLTWTFAEKIAWKKCVNNPQCGPTNLDNVNCAFYILFNMEIM